MSNNQLEDVYVSPSFSSYSTDHRLADIAGRVAVESSDAAAADDDFEFAFVREDEEEVLAEDFFRDGQIRQVFPVFKRQTHKDGGGGSDPPESIVAVSLGKLFIEEDRDRDDPPSCSSSTSEVDDELENVPAGTYCVWRPKSAEPPLPTQCEKSKSTGSASGRWKLRDLMRRSKSDGNDSFVFLTPKGKSIGGPRVVRRSAHEEFYVRNKAMKDGDKKKSYLPYRQELVGFFANVNGVSRSRLAHK